MICWQCTNEKQHIKPMQVFNSNFWVESSSSFIIKLKIKNDFEYEFESKLKIGVLLIIFKLFQFKKHIKPDQWQRIILNRLTNIQSFHKFKRMWKTTGYPLGRTVKPGGSWSIGPGFETLECQFISYARLSHDMTAKFDGRT